MMDRTDYGNLPSGVLQQHSKKSAFSTLANEPIWWITYRCTKRHSCKAIGACWSLFVSVSLG